MHMIDMGVVDEDMVKWAQCMLFSELRAAGFRFNLKEVLLHNLRPLHGAAAHVRESWPIWEFEPWMKIAFIITYEEIM